MTEFQATVYSFLLPKEILWFFYSIATLVALEFLDRRIDDNQEDGEMMSIIQASKN